MLSVLLACAGLLSMAVADSATFTPQVQFSSSIGVLGCKVDYNRVAYFPYLPGCDNLCVKVSYGDRSVNLLHIDTSGAAHDISADAFTYLITGQEASASNPVPSTPTEMEWSVISMDNCYGLIWTPDYKLPIIAESPTAVVNCKANEPSSWLANNYTLYNYVNSCCTLGVEDVCEFPSPYYGGAQPTCQLSQLGVQTSANTKCMNVAMDGIKSPCVC
ncbi:hypothetical protein ANO11243_085980 [Dothideomycetidae sp. 11243]|nr:hypothetical protein ANO11243_085980 [fungal sp. No.11243]